jgi:hypothetical protein
VGNVPTDVNNAPPARPSCSLLSPPRLETGWTRPSRRGVHCLPERWRIPTQGRGLGNEPRGYGVAIRVAVRSYVPTYPGTGQPDTSPVGSLSDQDTPRALEFWLATPPVIHSDYWLGWVGLGQSQAGGRVRVGMGVGMMCIYSGRYFSGSTSLSVGVGDIG